MPDTTPNEAQYETEVIPHESQFTYEDFDQGRVFQFLSAIADPYEQAMAERRMAALAGQLRFRNFTKLFRLYKKLHEKRNLPIIDEGGLTDFEGIPAELNTGDWHADDYGIWKPAAGGLGNIVACSHPIMPVKRMRSIDTKAIKYQLAFRRGTAQRSQIEYVDIDAADMASPNDIVKKLAPYGISVTGGDRAKALVDYFRDVTDLNYDIITEVRSVSRMGWNEEGFSPYVDGIAFDGAATFAGVYRSICQVGDRQKWLDEALDARTYSIPARIVLAASFAAPLVEPLGVLPFFVHLWSSCSGTGKTVCLMLGASVWANPVSGGPFFPTFRSTSVGIEMLAGFLHSMPLFIDELQLAKDHHGQVRFNVYELASGAGKLRSNRALGLNYTPTWNNCFITSGETPIVSETDGEGAMNRVFEVELGADEVAVNDGHRTANAVRDNYGWAGRQFVEELQKDGQIDRAKALYDKFYQDCIANDTTGKQAMAAACLLTADTLATEWIFQDGKALTVDEISAFMRTREAISLMERGYQAIVDWVAINANKLRGLRDEDHGECYGIIENGTAKIIRSVFARVCEENGLSEKGLLSHLRSRRLIECARKGFTKTARLSANQTAACVWLKLPKDESSENDDFEPLQIDVDSLPF